MASNKMLQSIENLCASCHQACMCCVSISDSILVDFGSTKDAESKSDAKIAYLEAAACANQ